MSLQIDEALLNHNFETYRINLKKLTRKDKEVHCDLYHWNKIGNCANHSKVKAYGLHNYLILDDFNQSHVYFTSIDGKIYKTVYCEISDKLTDPKIVFETQSSSNSNCERLPANLYFPSSNIACFSDGKGFLNIINTSDRSVIGNENGEWRLICSTSTLDDSVNMSLLECRLEYVEQALTTDSLSGTVLHCCFLKISESGCEIFSKNIDLIWFVYKYDDKTNDFCVVDKKVWKGNSPPEMVTFSNDFKTLEIISDHSFRFISPKINIDELCKENIDSIPYWCNETEDSVVMEFYLNIDRDRFNIDFKYPTDQSVEFVVFITITGKETWELYRNDSYFLLDNDKTYWTMKHGLLLITLKKFIKSTEIDEELFSKKPKLTVIGSEEIDNLDDIDLEIAQFDFVTGSTLNEINISRNQWLFKTRLGPNQPMSACLRSNFDGLLWTKTDSLSSSDWVHRHTLNAFGYVSAAKIDRKFMICSLPKKEKNGIDFAVIADWKRELYVLMQSRKLESSMTLKNRNTGRIVDNVSDEYLVTLEKSKQIMGAVANGDLIFVLYVISDNVTGISVIDCD